MEYEQKQRMSPEEVGKGAIEERTEKAVRKEH